MKRFERDLSPYNDASWIKLVPLKFKFFTWTLLQNVLLTKDNLEICGIVLPNRNLCPSESGVKESAQHLFF